MSLPELIYRQSPEIDHVATGAAIKAARIARGLSLWTVASQMSGHTASYLADLESGRRRWNQQKLDLARGALRKVEPKL